MNTSWQAMMLGIVATMAIHSQTRLSEIRGSICSLVLRSPNKQALAGCSGTLVGSTVILTSSPCLNTGIQYWFDASTGEKSARLKPEFVGATWWWAAASADGRFVYRPVRKTMLNPKYDELAGVHQIGVAIIDPISAGAPVAEIMPADSQSKEGVKALRTLVAGVCVAVGITRTGEMNQRPVSILKPNELANMFPPPLNSPAAAMNMFAALLPSAPYDRDPTETGGPLLCSQSGKGGWIMMGIIGESVHPFSPMSGKVSVHASIGDDPWLASVLKAEIRYGETPARRH